jgi:hypothetical protein
MQNFIHSLMKKGNEAVLVVILFTLIFTWLTTVNMVHPWL